MPATVRGRTRSVPVDEFRDLVKALHRAGIEVILDVVYNHTAEGNAEGPTLCFRGLANEVYYILDNDRARLRKLQWHRKYSERQSVDRAPHDSRQPAVLGHPHARRWVPLRPRLDPVPGRNRVARSKIPRFSGISSRIPSSPAPN